jgi:hypothetical protein
MALPNTIIGAHVYNWYECKFGFDAFTVEHMLSVSGVKPKVEQVPQFGTGREAIDIATGKVELDPITASMYAHEWQKLKAYLFTKSLGRGLALTSFSFTAMALGNPLEGAPPIGDIFGGCKLAEIGKEYGQDANGLKVDITFQPRTHRDLDGMSLVSF